MLMYGRNQHNAIIILQLKINLNKKTYALKSSEQMVRKQSEPAERRIDKLEKCWAETTPCAAERWIKYEEPNMADRWEGPLYIHQS